MYAICIPLYNSVPEPEPFTGQLVDDEEINQMFKWANGKIAEMVFYCHSFRVTNSLLGLTPDMIVYLAAIHAYVNKSHFDFGSFMRRLASYFKSIVSLL